MQDEVIVNLADFRQSGMIISENHLSRLDLNSISIFFS